MTNIEVYKELGTYERHFNQMQGIHRTLASTWLLGTFGGIGYVFSSHFSHPGAFEPEQVASLIALAGASGIFLLWILDVMVYHRMLVAVLKESKRLEAADHELPQLRASFETQALGPWRIGARRKISLFYALPAAGLWVAALALTRAAVGNGPLSQASGIWLAILFGCVVWMFMMGRPKDSQQTNELKNMELMQTLDDAWNSQDWDTFDKRHKKDVLVRWAG
ncbi:MAG TPA: hypothetical protein VGQ17_03765, partial [Gemmatimonadales bacterium]|nr:hypothetical protein [Gemmatimonadales bacterium]